MTRRARATNLAAVPGPEFALAKLLGSETNIAVHEITLDALGTAGMLVDTYEMMVPDSRESVRAEPDVAGLASLRSRGNTIEGGTSEVQRNVLGDGCSGLRGDVAQHTRRRESMSGRVRRLGQGLPSHR